MFVKKKYKYQHMNISNDSFVRYENILTYPLQGK